MSELNYIRKGDYLLPDLSLPRTASSKVNKYGRMRLKYLQEQDQIMYQVMLLNGTLVQHLTEVSLQASRYLEETMPILMQQNNVTEQLKETDPMRWTGMMNNLKAQAEEVIRQELICS